MSYHARMLQRKREARYAVIADQTTDAQTADLELGGRISEVTEVET